MGMGASCLSTSFPEISPYHDDPTAQKLHSRQYSSLRYSSGKTFRKMMHEMNAAEGGPQGLGSHNSKCFTPGSLLSSSTSSGGDQQNASTPLLQSSPAPREGDYPLNADCSPNNDSDARHFTAAHSRDSLQKGDYCKLPQIFHRRDLTHKSKLTSSEKKIIYKLKIDHTVAEVLERDGTYLTLRLVNVHGQWETRKRIWLMYVTKIPDHVFQQEAKRLRYTLGKLNHKIADLLQKVREWHRECGHMLDSKIERIDSSVDAHYRCAVCGKILGFERKSLTDQTKSIFDVYDMPWFKASFPEHLKVGMDCREGDCTLVRKKELQFAESKGWIRKLDKDLALFNSREYLTDALTIIANSNMGG